MGERRKTDFTEEMKDLELCYESDVSVQKGSFRSVWLMSDGTF